MLVVPGLPRVEVADPAVPRTLLEAEVEDIVTGFLLC